MKTTVSSYHTGIVGPTKRRSIIKKLVKALKDAEFDMIAVSGISGIGIGSILAYRLNKPLTIIRKKDEQSHGQYIEGFVPDPGETVLWLDDIIASGDTRRRVFKALEQKQPDFKFMQCLYLTDDDIKLRQWSEGEY